MPQDSTTMWKAQRVQRAAAVAANKWIQKNIM